MELKALKQERAKVKTAIAAPNETQISELTGRKALLDSHIALREAEQAKTKDLFNSTSPDEFARFFSAIAHIDPQLKTYRVLAESLIDSLNRATDQKKAAFLTALFGTGRPTIENETTVFKELLDPVKGAKERTTGFLTHGIRQLIKENSLSSIATLRSMVSKQNLMTSQDSELKTAYDNARTAADLDPPQKETTYSSRLSQESGKRGKFLQRVGLLKHITPSSARRAGNAVISLLNTRVQELKLLKDNPQSLLEHAEALYAEITQLEANPTFQALLKGNATLRENFETAKKAFTDPEQNQWFKTAAENHLRALQSEVTSLSTESDPAKLSDAIKPLEQKVNKLGNNQAFKALLPQGNETNELKNSLQEIRNLLQTEKRRAQLIKNRKDLEPKILQFQNISSAESIPQHFFEQAATLFKEIQKNLTQSQGILEERTLFEAHNSVIVNKFKDVTSGRLRVLSKRLEQIPVDSETPKSQLYQQMKKIQDEMRELEEHPVFKDGVEKGDLVRSQLEKLKQELTKKFTQLFNPLLAEFQDTLSKLETSSEINDAYYNQLNTVQTTMSALQENPIFQSALEEKPDMKLFFAGLQERAMTSISMAFSTQMDAIDQGIGQLAQDKQAYIKLRTTISSLEQNPLFKALLKHDPAIRNRFEQQKAKFFKSFNIYMLKSTDTAVQAVSVDIPETQAVTAIPTDFTTTTPIKEQQADHLWAKAFLSTHLGQIGAELRFVRPPSTSVPDRETVTVTPDTLDSSVFSYEVTRGVTGDIQRDGMRQADDIVMYVAASQFNGAEANTRLTIAPGAACEKYQIDPTQGPQAQLAFPKEQVERINLGANAKFNGVVRVLDDKTRGAVQHGYLTPRTQAEALAVNQQLRNNGHQIEYLCVANEPLQPGSETEKGTKKVHLFLTAAPAWGTYANVDGPNTTDQNEQLENQYLCLLHSYRAQFQQGIALAKETGKPVTIKTLPLGGGVFGTDPEAAARAFYQAATEYQAQLKKKGVKVLFQHYIHPNNQVTAPSPTTMLGKLGLQKHPPPAPR